MLPNLDLGPDCGDNFIKVNGRSMEKHTAIQHTHV